MRPGANRDAWVFLWVVAFVLLIVVFVTVTSDRAAMMCLVNQT